MSKPIDRAKLRTRFPNLDQSIGRTVADMADYYVEEKPRVWTDVRPLQRDGLSVAGRWVAYVHGRHPKLEEGTWPVIPDEHNPRPDKLIKADDPPHVFWSMIEAERHAEEAAANLLQQLKEV